MNLENLALVRRIIKEAGRNSFGTNIPSRKILKRLRQAGWELVRTKGSHHHFRHPDMFGMITVLHPRKNISKNVLKKIEEISGLTFDK